MTDQTINSIIEDCIRSLMDKFQESPRFFLTESDLQSYLYHLLVSNQPLSTAHITRSGYEIGLVHTEYPATGGRFDLAVLDPDAVEKHNLKDQRKICGVEIGLNRSYAHFKKDYCTKFTPEAGNNVEYGYIIHCTIASNADWEKIVEEVGKLTEAGASTVLKKIDTSEAKAIAVKTRV